MSTNPRVVHWSDCAVNRGPAYEPGPCDCGGIARGTIDRLAEALWRSHILMSVGIAAATLREWSEVLPDTQDDWRYKAEQLDGCLSAAGLDLVVKP